MDSSNKELEYSLNGAIAKISIRESNRKAFLELIIDKDTFDYSQFDFVNFEDRVCDWIETKLAITYIDTKALKFSFDTFKTKHESAERRIAHGVEAKSGTDGKVVLLVKPFQNAFDGDYDFKNRYLKKFDIVPKGSIIARVYKPRDGVVGRDIFNSIIPFEPGKEVDLELSPLLSINKNNGSYDEIVALEDGYIKYVQNKNKATFQLETKLVFPSGVNHKTGAAHFISEIEIRGDVMEGFTVDAGKNIVIHGNVYQSNISSKYGTITINGSVIDQDISDDTFDTFLNGDAENQHLIRAKGDVSTLSIQNARIFSEANIKITGGCMRSHLYSSGMITCTGAIFASRASSVCGIEASQFGNESEVNTIIEFLHPFEASIEYVDSKKKQERLEEKAKKLELFLGPYLENSSLLKKLHASHKSKITNAISEYSAIRIKVKEIQDQRMALEKNAPRNSYSQLNCVSLCYPHVQIKAGEERFEFTTIQKRKFSLIFDWNTKTFSVIDFKPLICEMNKGAPSNEN